MKYTIRNLYHKKQLISLAIFILAALFVWFFGPAIAINGDAVLGPPQKRFYVIALLLLAWVWKFIFLTRYRAI